MPTLTKAVRKAYSFAKKREYLSILTTEVQKLESKLSLESLYLETSRKLIAKIRSLDTDAVYLSMSNQNYLDLLIRGVTDSVNLTQRIAYRKAIENIWSNVFDLGVTHTLRDLLFNTGLFTSEIVGSSFSSMDGINLAEFISSTAEFAKKGDSTNSNNRYIGRARRQLTNLINNTDSLKKAGILYDGFDLTNSTGVAARMSIEQRIAFLTMLEDISTTYNKVEASKAGFLSNTYTKTRYSVLTDSYSKSVDNYVKLQIKKYLAKNIEGINQIRSQPEITDALARQLAAKIQAANIELVNPIQKSKNILRTELSIAYNFGKLVGFSGEEDLTKQFIWRADWELEDTKPGYEICTACLNMDGEIYTIADLLRVGAVLDGGILKYQGKSRTAFKNPTIPQIPFHPGCNCYWELVPQAEEEEEKAKDVNVPAPPKQKRSKTSDLIIGSSLVVAGSFLLARSNIWKAFLNTAVSSTDQAKTTYNPLEDLISVVKYIRLNNKASVGDKLTDLIQTVVTTPKGKVLVP